MTRNITFHGIKPSKKAFKKYTAVFTVDNAIKYVDFGHSLYQDYTTHKNHNRMLNYRRRHAKDNINDPLSPGALSWYILWSSPSLATGIENYKFTFNF